MKTTSIPDYRYEAAGRRWCIPSLELTEVPDGSQAISESEIRRVHTAIANEICGSESALTIEELDFLSDTAGVTLSEVARELDLHKSTLSKWRSTGSISKVMYSMRLKKLFWFRLFGDQLADQRIPLHQVRDEQEFLHYAHERAIQEKLADPVQALAA